MTTLEESNKATIEHIIRVQQYLVDAAMILLRRAQKHDASKLVEPEASGYAELKIKLGDCAYGSDEYKAALAEAKETIQHHYQNNSHHPEHYPNGIDGMNLFDIVEMFFDWKAASERTYQGGDIRKSISENKTRFNMSDQLVAIFMNTVDKMKW